MGKSVSKTPGKKDSKKSDAKTRLDECLQKHDKEDSGVITKADATEAFNELIPDFPEENLQHLLKHFDKDDEDKINIEELSSFLSRVKNKKDEAKNTDWLDTSNDEKISYTDLKTLLTDTYQLDDDTTKILVLMCDGSEDGEIDRKVFDNLWTTLLKW